VGPHGIPNGGDASTPDPEKAPRIPSVPSVASATASTSVFSADGNADGIVRQGGLPSTIASARNPHADAPADDMDVADGISRAFSDVETQMLAALRKRGRVPVWELARELGLSDADAVAATERLLATGLAQRVGNDRPAPLSVRSKIAATPFPQVPVSDARVLKGDGAPGRPRCPRCGGEFVPAARHPEWLQCAACGVYARADDQAFRLAEGGAR
jgi:ribosomal protein S27AE